MAESVDSKVPPVFSLDRQAATAERVTAEAAEAAQPVPVSSSISSDPAAVPVELREPATTSAPEVVLVASQLDHRSTAQALSLETTTMLKAMAQATAALVPSTA